MTVIFDGKTLAEQREVKVRTQVTELRQRGAVIKVAAVLYQEDAGSQLYTRLKAEAAARVGIEYSVTTFSIADGVMPVIEHLTKLNQDPTVTGIIIQKPWRRTWQEASSVHGPAKAVRQAFQSWWRYQTTQIALEKDVDGLHPATMATIEAGTWQAERRVLPATAAAVMTILTTAQPELLATASEKQAIILGKSDILGQPLYFLLKQQGFKVQLLGSKDVQQRLEAGLGLLDADLVVSATGQANLVTGSLVKAGVVVIDVGEPQPDIDFETVAPKAAFITPVPGGVGPLTVISLLENAVTLAQR